MNSYEKQIEVRWSDCDANRHVRHSAYYDYGAHCRIRFFSDLGFDSKTMTNKRIGPIIFKEECAFIKELRPEDIIVVNVLKGDISFDGSRWILHHEIFNQHKEKCAHITLKGAWMNLGERKLTTPPRELAKALSELPVGEEYVYSKGE